MLNVHCDMELVKLIREWELNYLLLEGIYWKGFNNFALFGQKQQKLFKRPWKRMIWRKCGIISRLFYLVTMKIFQNEILILNYNFNTCLPSRRKRKQNSPEWFSWKNILLLQDFTVSGMTLVCQIIFATSFGELLK